MVLDSFSLHEDYSTGTFIYTSCPRPPLILISQQLGQSSPIILLSQLELLNDKQSHPSELTFLPQLPPIEHINPATWNSAFLEVFFPCGTGINQFEKAINFAIFATLNMFSVLRGCLCCYKTAPEDNETTIEEDHTYIELDPENALAEVSMIVHTDEPRTPLHLYNKLLTECAYDELDGSPVNELFNCTFINVNDIDDPLVDRVNCTLTTYDGFSIAREFMDLWKLPCFVVCRQSDHSITRMELLAIGSPAAINWISMMIANEQVMKRFFRYSGLMFAQNDCAVTVPRNYPTVFVPPSTPIAKQTPKTQYHQPAPGSAPPQVQYLHYTDSATESEDGDSVLWPETYLQGTYC